jgi:hypothetical protein
MSSSAQFSVTVAPMSNRTSAYSIPPARKVSPLRQRMIDDMTVRNLAPNTVLCYPEAGQLPVAVFWQVATAGPLSVFRSASIDP